MIKPHNLQRDCFQHTEHMCTSRDNTDIDWVSGPSSVEEMGVHRSTLKEACNPRQRFESAHLLVHIISDIVKLSQLNLANCYEFLSWISTRILRWDTPDNLISQQLNANTKLHVSLWIKKICHSGSPRYFRTVEHSCGVLDHGPKIPSIDYIWLYIGKCNKNIGYHYNH